MTDRPNEMVKYYRKQYGIYDGDWERDDRQIKVYLACPFSHKNPMVRKRRVFISTMCAAMILKNGYMVYSPLTHTSSIAEFLPPENECSWKYWKDISLTFVDWADELWVIMLNGWQKSIGVAAEIKHANKNQMKTRYYYPKDIIKEKFLLPE